MTSYSVGTISYQSTALSVDVLLMAYVIGPHQPVENLPF